MHGLNAEGARRRPSGRRRASLGGGARPQGAGSAPNAGVPSSGFAIVEVVVVLALLAALVPPAWGSVARIREAFLVHEAREAAARLFAEARWTALAEGGAAVVLRRDPPAGLVESAAGDTVQVADLGRGGVSLSWRGNQETARLRYGPLGLGRVSSRTLEFALGDASRSLVISSLGRVSRR